MKILNSRTATIALVAGLAILLAVAPGCRRSRKIPGVVPVEGVVLYEGIPLAWATITLAPAPAEKGAEPPEPGTVRVACGMTNQDGRFTVQTVGTKGALPGEYVVLVEKYIRKEENGVANWEQARSAAGYKEPEPEEGVIDAETAIPLKYSEKKSSPLRAVVEPKGSKDLKFELSKEK